MLCIIQRYPMYGKGKQPLFIFKSKHLGEERWVRRNGEKKRFVYTAMTNFGKLF